MTVSYNPIDTPSTSASGYLSAKFLVATSAQQVQVVGLSVDKALLRPYAYASSNIQHSVRFVQRSKK